MVKLFGWEQKMSAQLSTKRDAEMLWVRKREFASLANTIVNYIIPVLVMVSSYATFTVVMRRELTPSIVFSSMSIFDMLRGQLSQVVFRIPSIVQAKVSLDRVTEFMQNVRSLSLILSIESLSLTRLTRRPSFWTRTQSTTRRHYPPLRLTPT